MKIKHDRKNKRLWLSQEKYIERVLEKFNMKDAKPMSTPLSTHFKLSDKLSPTRNEEKKVKKKIPYA